MEAFLKSPNAKEINVLFAHNDDMALGAIQAMEEAGIKPGQDIKIVSIDGVRGAFEAMKDGKLNVTVECNPLLGPQLFDLIEKVANKQDSRNAWSAKRVFTNNHRQPPSCQRDNTKPSLIFCFKAGARPKDRAPEFYS